MDIENRHSSTTAKTALGLSIGALGVELLGAGGGGILAGLLNRSQNDIVTPALMQVIVGLIPTLMQNGYNCNKGVVSALESELAREKAERYADQTSIATFKEGVAALEKVTEKYDGRFEKVFDELVANRVEDARNEERIKCLQKETDYKIEGLRNEMKLGFTNLGHAIEVESERRANGDSNIKDWVECTFVKYKKVIDASEICPPVQLESAATA